VPRLISQSLIISCSQMSVLSRITLPNKLSIIVLDDFRCTTSSHPDSRNASLIIWTCHQLSGNDFAYFDGGGLLSIRLRAILGQIIISTHAIGTNHDFYLWDFTPWKISQNGVQPTPRNLIQSSPISTCVTKFRAPNSLDRVATITTELAP
jgi:hypothetical protein